MIPHAIYGFRLRVERAVGDADLVAETALPLGAASLSTLALAVGVILQTLEATPMAASRGADALLALRPGAVGAAVQMPSEARPADGERTRTATARPQDQDEDEEEGAGRVPASLLDTRTLIRVIDALDGRRPS